MPRVWLPSPLESDPTAHIRGAGETHPTGKAIPTGTSTASDLPGRLAIFPPVTEDRDTTMNRSLGPGLNVKIGIALGITCASRANRHTPRNIAPHGGCAFCARKMAKTQQGGKQLRNEVLSKPTGYPKVASFTRERTMNALVPTRKTSYHGIVASANTVVQPKHFGKKVQSRHAG